VSLLLVKLFLRMEVRGDTREEILEDWLWIEAFILTSYGTYKVSIRGYEQLLVVVLSLLLRHLHSRGAISASVPLQRGSARVNEAAMLLLSRRLAVL